MKQNSQDQILDIRGYKPVLLVDGAVKPNPTGEWGRSNIRSIPTGRISENKLIASIAKLSSEHTCVHVECFRESFTYQIIRWEIHQTPDNLLGVYPVSNLSILLKKAPEKQRFLVCAWQPSQVGLMIDICS